MTTSKIQKDARVKRKSAQGCQGIVKELKREVTSSSGDTKDKALMAIVLWDNGTLSTLSPQALAVVED